MLVKENLCVLFFSILIKKSLNGYILQIIQYSRTSIVCASLLCGFDITQSGLGPMMGAYSTITRATITESTIFEASQENRDTFTYYVCLRGISVYYFKVSQVLAFCVNEKVIEG